MKYLLLSLAFLAAGMTMAAQTTKWRDLHKVKKKETIYSISRDYGITVDELMEANPEMKSADYKLKKGTTVFIPFPSSHVVQAVTQPVQQPAENGKAVAETDVRNRAIRLGVMLPLHDINGDGKRMVEYYRGVLMACDSLKSQGISVDVYAWNVPEDGNVKQTLADPNAARCDMIIGPLYSKFVADMSAFVETHHIMMVIPFSINAPELYSNRHIFQVYQHPQEQNTTTARRFADWFADCHPVIVDCNDANSTKGPFTAALRAQLDSKTIAYSLTSLASADENFKKAFDAAKKNVVVLNSARVADMNALFGKLSAVTLANPDLQISVFGYTDWMSMADRQLENFYRYNVYIPSHFYTNLATPAAATLSAKYRQNFNQPMMPTCPRFAITGFDHAYFFLKGLHKYGKEFDGAAGRFGYPPVQTPLKFERIGNGGLQNRAYLFVHYKPEHQIELLNY